MKEAIDLCKLIEQFGSEERCREYLEQLRWPDAKSLLEVQIREGLSHPWPRPIALRVMRIPDFP